MNNDNATFAVLNIRHDGMFLGQAHQFTCMETKGSFTMPVGFDRQDLVIKLTAFRAGFAQPKVAPGFMPSRSQVIAGISSVFQ